MSYTSAVTPPLPTSLHPLFCLGKLTSLALGNCFSIFCPALVRLDQWEAPAGNQQGNESEVRVLMPTHSSPRSPWTDSRWLSLLDSPSGIINCSLSHTSPSYSDVTLCSSSWSPLLSLWSHSPANTFTSRPFIKPSLEYPNLNVPFVSC